MATFSQQIKDEQIALNSKGATLITDGLLGPKTLAARVKFSNPPLKITTIQPEKIDLKKMQDEALKAQQESEQTNSFWGLLKNTITGIPKVVKEVAVGRADTQGGIIRNTILGVPKEVPGVLKSIGVELKEQFTNPSAEQKNYENTILPYGTTPITKVLTAPGVATARVITRFLNIGLQPLATDLAEIRAINEKGGIADQVANGIIPASVLDEFATLQKTAPQIVGDVAQAVLTAYAGRQAEKLLVGSVKQPIKSAITTGFKSGIQVGTAFGTGAALSSGSKDPLEIISTIGTTGALGGVLGAITSGAIPVSKEVLGKVKEAKVLYDSLTPGEKQSGKIKNLFADNKTEIPEPLKPLAEKANEMTKEDFGRLFNDGLNNQNLTTKETAQLHLNAIKKAGFPTLEDFYNKATGKTEAKKIQNKLDREYENQLNTLANRSSMDDMAFGNFEREQVAIKNRVYGKDKLLEEKQTLSNEIKKIKNETTYKVDETAQRMVKAREKSITVIDNELSKKSMADRSTRLVEKPGVQNEVGKVPAKPKDITKEIIKEPIPKESIQTVAESSLADKSGENIPSDKLYKQKEEKAIAKIAINTLEPKSTVRSVVNTIKKAKTSILEYVQNTEERVRELTTKKDIKIDDASDPYLKMTLYPGKVANKIEIVKEEAKAIIQGVKNDKITRKEVSDYLLYRHAPERNLALGEKAAGITTLEAKVGLKTLENSPNSVKIKEYADRVQKINEGTLDILNETGIISDELYNTLREKYKNHVPLNRIFEETENMGEVLSGKGFDVKSTGIKRAVGSEREVSDIMTNVLTNYEQAVLRAEKNVVDQATLAFVRKNKDILGDLFEIKSPKAIGQTFDGKMILEKTQDPTILQLFENGKRVWIKINDPHLAIALRGVGREKLGTLLNVVGTFTRFYSGLATRFNPEFALPNKIRDLQETAVYLASQKDFGFKSSFKAVARDPASVKNVLDALRGKDTPGAKLYNEMKSMGGTTGGMGLSTKKQVELNLDKLDKLANSRARRIGNNLVEYVDNWNTIFEDSTRLSVYKQALDQGLSKERAAFLAKEASINFNRMGKGGPIVNAIWMFANASIQGSTKMVRALKNPKVLGAVVALVGGSVVAVSEWNDKVDPDWRDKVSKWDRLNGLTVMLPSTDEKGGAHYFTIPVSWGIKPIKVMADYAYDAVDGKGFSPTKMASGVLSSILEAYNPVGGTDLVSALTPTILDAPVDIARNRAWSGSKIRPDFDKNAPKDIQYFDSLGETKTGQVAINISEILQNKLNIGVSPADIKYAYEQYVGGLGRASSKTVNLISGLATNTRPPLDEYPIVSRFYRQRTEEELGAGAGGKTGEIKDILSEQSRQRFDFKKEAEKLDAELQKLPPDQAKQRWEEINKENPDLANKLADVVEERKLGLTYQEKLMKELLVGTGERAKYIDEQIMKLPANEREAYYNDLVRKKVISPNVAEQLSSLRAKNK